MVSHHTFYVGLLLCLMALPTTASKTTQYFRSCDLLLDAGLQDLILLPDSDAYAKREASYWAANVKLQPSCIIQPHTSQDVSRIVKVLNNADGPVAVRSGGHTQWAGSNDVHHGVTIDLGLMTDVSYDAHSNLALIQPGSRWGDVYKKLLDHSVCVTGGRDGNVGIGGFLTGGGISYYAGLYGLACDTVANFEIVVANGDIINANANSHSDLWTALKGGSGNFGIVTRFDMYAFPAHDVWGGVRVATRSEGDKLAQSMVDFTNNVENNPEDAYIINYTYGPNSPDILAAHVVIATSGVVNASAFSQIQQIPVIMDDVEKRSMANMADSYLLPGNQQQTWFSLTFRNDVEVIKKAADMHDELVNELKVLMPGDFATQCLFQPMPTLFAQRSVERGGNMLGLDKVQENALLGLITGSTETPEHNAIMRDKLAAFATTLESFARSKKLNIDWQYLNYVDQTQNPLKSYGQDNIEYIRRVAAKYDRSAMFQKKVVSGWKISAVDA
ncbi:hypothetical protein BKA63DRAFT_526004 [Paraphoma chrysanthemicola]|nr:hypothetical protein BKA63DRAFT_526004 [Paraphoma chrysanthemicola]